MGEGGQGGWGAGAATQESIGGAQGRLGRRALTLGLTGMHTHPRMLTSMSTSAHVLTCVHTPSLVLVCVSLPGERAARGILVIQHCLSRQPLLGQPLVPSPEQIDCHGGVRHLLAGPEGRPPHLAPGSAILATRGVCGSWPGSCQLPWAEGPARRPKPGAHGCSTPRGGLSPGGVCGPRPTLTHTTTWMDLKNLVLSERSQDKGPRSAWFHFCEVSTRGNSARPKTEWLPGAGGGTGGGC